MSPRVVAHIPSIALTFSMSRSNAAALEGLPEMNGWFVRTKHPPSAWGLRFEGPHLQDLGGAFDDAAAGDTGVERILFPVVECPVDGDLDQCSFRRRARRHQVGLVAVEQTRVVQKPAIGEQLGCVPVHFPPGRAISDAADARDLLERVEPPVEVACLGRRVEALHRFVQIPVVPHLVTAVDDGADRVGIALGGESRHEERCANVLTFEYSQNALADVLAHPSLAAGRPAVRAGADLLAQPVRWCIRVKSSTSRTFFAAASCC